jgi:DNA-binding transcriptional regulator YiaG
MRGLVKENVATRARKATGLEQKDFAEIYRIPLSTLRNHEQGRIGANNLTAYYQLIAVHPNEIKEMLKSIPL